jgi:hypothetical protein
MEGQMKNPLLIGALAVLLCFAFGCQKKAEKAELEKHGHGQDAGILDAPAGQRDELTELGEERDNRFQPAEKIMDAIGLKPGMVIGEVGDTGGIPGQRR